MSIMLGHVRIDYTYTLGLFICMRGLGLVRASVEVRYCLFAAMVCAGCVAFFGGNTIAVYGSGVGDMKCKE